MDASQQKFGWSFHPNQNPPHVVTKNLFSYFDLLDVLTSSQYYNFKTDDLLIHILYQLLFKRIVFFEGPHNMMK